jgi:hypothetical protein
MNWPAVVIARIGPHFLSLLQTSRAEITALVAVVVTLIGVRLCWRAPRYRMSIEERAKDGAISEDQARRKIAVFRWLGPVLAVLGCALLSAALLS